MDAASPLDARQARGMALVKAQRSKIKHVAGSRWLVPSQTNPSGGYVVDVEQNACSCPDHEDRGVKCKHLWAVAYFRHEVTLPDGSTVVTEQRITYRQDWPAYNAAQTEERRTARTAIVKSACSASLPARCARLGCEQAEQSIRGATPVLRALHSLAPGSQSLAPLLRRP